MSKLDLVVSLLRDHFQSNLVAVLQYGSSTTSVHPADIDMLIVLNYKVNTQSDLQSLKEVSGKFPDIYFDLQLVYLGEIKDPDNFSLDSHGCFFVLVLKEATVLWGKNPFHTYTPNNICIVKSVVRKIQYYVFRARQMFLGEAYRSKDKNPDFHRKKIMMAMVSVLLCSRPEPSKVPLNDFVKSYPGYLTQSEITSISDNTKPLDIETAMPIYEKLYDLVINKFQIPQEEI